MLSILAIHNPVIIVIVLCHSSEISVGQLRNALSVLDPSKPEAEVDQAVGIAFSISTGQLVEDNLMIPVDQIAERLLTSPIAKSVYNEAV